MEGKADISMRIIVQTKENFENPFRLLLIGKKTNAKCSYIDVNYNDLLFQKEYGQASGFKNRYELIEKEQNYSVAIISEDFIENKELSGEEVKFYRDWRVLEIEKIDGYQKLSEKNDVFFEILQPTTLRQNTNYIFQFKFVLEGFIENEICDLMKKSGSSWSFSINMHQKTLFQEFFDMYGNYLVKPDSLELWIFVPHGHTLGVFSPDLETPFSLTSKDAEEQNQFLDDKLENFERMQGDLALKFLEYPLESENFMINCTSPINIPPINTDQIARDIYEIGIEPFHLTKKAFLSFLPRRREDARRLIVGVIVPIAGFISSLATHFKLAEIWFSLSWIFDGIAFFLIVFILLWRKNDLQKAINSYCGENNHFRKKFLSIIILYAVPLSLIAFSLLFAGLTNLIFAILKFDFELSVFIFIFMYSWLIFTFIYSYGLEKIS